MSCESLYRGMSYLQKQSDLGPTITTPTKAEIEECSENDRFLGLSPETAELWKNLGDTPDSKALKEEYLRAHGFSSGSCGGSTTSETTQILPGANMQATAVAAVAAGESRKRLMDDADDAGLNKRMKDECAALEKFRDEQMSRLREQMQQELLQHEQALAEARKQHEMALQAEQEKYEHQMMIQQAEHQAAMQDEKDQHEHNLCLLIEQASAAKAEADRAQNPVPKQAAAPPAQPKPDVGDAKAKLRAKLEAQTPGPGPMPDQQVPPRTQNQLTLQQNPSPAQNQLAVQTAMPSAQNPPPAHNQLTVQTAPPPAQNQLALQTATPAAQNQLAVQTATPPPQGIGNGPFNSSTHPAAWGALYRITRAPDCLQEIRQAWDGGDFQRQNLLRDFIGSYSWKTEAEMRKPPLEWEDLYDPNIRKFLVLVRDDVESAEEKLQELQQEMAQMGLLNSDFELGDIMEELEGDSSTENKPVPSKKRLAEYPVVEGEETIQEYLGQYRRAILSRKALLKGARERLEKEGAKGHDSLCQDGCEEQGRHIKECDSDHVENVLNAYVESSGKRAAKLAVDFAKVVLSGQWAPKLLAGHHLADKVWDTGDDLCCSYPGAGNRILDKLFDEMARSLRRAYWAGITVGDVTFHLVPLGLSGDHIFQTKAYRAIRHHTCNEICPHCLANVSDVPFEHIHMSATWTQTVFKCVPWTKTPAFAAIPGGDEPSFIQFDLMHVLPHGCGRTFIASVICMMAGPLALFGPTSKQTSRATRLHEAFTSFSSYCEAQGLHPRDMQEFTIDNLGWDTKASFPDCSCKAMDCVMMFQWCIDLLSSVPFARNDALDWAYAGCCGFDDFNRLCYCSEDRIFWTREEAKQGYAHLRKFLKAYRALAFYWHQHSWTLFNIVPKFHFAAHWLWSLHEFLQSDLLWCLNPGAFATPMMEGFVGYTSRISRTTHPSAVAIGTIRKYLVEVRKAWLSND
ncbi:unnamed protein product [Symbiodinium sp. CCMP2592]|nr:unnamed protein product [Symbiodinium sp. CCMP2592]